MNVRSMLEEALLTASDGGAVLEIISVVMAAVVPAKMSGE